jgi:hypothetical protein
METRVTPLRLPLVFFLGLALAGPACAQFGGGTGGSRRGGAGGGAENRARSAEPSAGVTRLSQNDQIRLQLTDVRLALKLTPEQAASWQAYEDKVINLLADLSRGGEVPMGGSALLQIEGRIDIVRNRLTAMEDLSDAAKKLYAGLSDEQQTLADRMLPGTVPTLYSGAGAPAPGRGRPGER